MGSAFTYQGELKKNGSPVNATCNMAFRLYDDATAGNLQGLITTTVTVENGLFTVVLDFGEGPFTGEARFLQVSVQCPGDAGFNTLSPRQELTAAPYALSLSPGAEISGAVGNGAILYALNTDTEATLFAYGLLGRVSSTKGYGVVGHANALSGETYGVYGRSDSTAGRGVYGIATATSGENYGVYGSTASMQGTAIYGAGGASGVYGVGHSCGVHGEGIWGVVGRSENSSGCGVLGRAEATSGYTKGVAGHSDSTQGCGVYGYADANSGFTYGVYGHSMSNSGTGVYGLADANSGFTYGVYGLSMSNSGTGVYGVAGDHSGFTYGVYGRSDSTDGRGVYGVATATSGTTYGVYGHSDSPSGYGVYGEGIAVGVYGRGKNAVIGISEEPGYAAVYGRNAATTGSGIGVYGQTYSASGYAGYFSGNVHVNGTFTAVNKLFKIDHPLDPANKYLYHYSVESAEVLNQYSGNVVLDAEGSAWVELPSWFGALNRDVRYLLTPIGAPAPGLYIAQEIRDNRFQIAGGPPGLKVSWLVTAVRNDPYIQRYGAPVEVEKPEGERGTYLFPDLYGQPREAGYDYRFNPGRPAEVPPAADLPSVEVEP